MISAHYLGAACSPLNLATGQTFGETFKLIGIQVAVNEILYAYPTLLVNLGDVRTDGVLDSQTASVIHEIFAWSSRYGDLPGPRADIAALGSDACALADAADAILAELRALLAEIKETGAPRRSLTTETAAKPRNPAYLALAVAGFGIAIVGGYVAFSRKRR